MPRGDKLQGVNPRRFNNNLVAFFSTYNQDRIHTIKVGVMKRNIPVSPVGKILKDIRLERCMSVQAVADICDVAPSTIRNYENSIHPQLDAVEAIAEALGYEVDILLKKD